MKKGEPLIVIELTTGETEYLLEVIADRLEGIALAKEETIKDRSVHSAETLTELALGHDEDRELLESVRKKIMGVTNVSTT